MHNAIPEHSEASRATANGNANITTIVMAIQIMIILRLSTVVCDFSGKINLLFLSGFREREFFPHCFYYFQRLMSVLEVKNISLLSSHVGAAGLRISHHFSDAGQLFYKCRIVASRYHTFAIYVNDIITHHLAAVHFSKRCKHIADKLYKLR